MTIAMSARRPREGRATVCASVFIVCSTLLRPVLVEREAKRASLGVFADGPLRSGMNDAPTELLHPLERSVEIAHLEIRQRDRVSRAATPAVDADDGTAIARVPTLPFARSARL
jgi:hypothetical protein